MAGIRIPLSAIKIFQSGGTICHVRCGQVLRQCSGRHMGTFEERAGANHEGGAGQQYCQKKPTLHKVSPEAPGFPSLTLFGLELALPDSTDTRKNHAPLHRFHGRRHDVDELTYSCVRRICREIDCMYVATFLLLSVVDPATAKSERGEEMPRESLSYPAPGFRS